MSGIDQVLDALDLVVSRAAAGLGETAVAEAARIARTARDRTGFSGGTLLVAIAGGTGSGKSSLLNAIAGETVAPVGVTRPYTADPLAWVPESAEPALESLLDELGIERRATHDVLPGIGLVDLPDTDSVVADHRALVRALLPRLDVVLWVLDPEKYRDPALHDEFLRPMAGYAELFAFVLNQIDRIPGAVPAVVEDLRRALADGGVGGAPVFSIAAAPATGPAQGVDDVVDFLLHRLDAKRVTTAKLLADVRAAAAAIANAAGIDAAARLDLERRWYEVASGSADAIAADAAGLDDARCRVEDFVAAVAAEAGPGFGPRLRTALPPARIEHAFAAAGEAAGTAPPPPRRSRWRRWWRRSSQRPRGAAEAQAVLDRSVGDVLRGELWGRAELAALLAGLEVEVAAAKKRLGGG